MDFAILKEHPCFECFPVHISTFSQDFSGRYIPNNLNYEYINTIEEKLQQYRAI